MFFSTDWYEIPNPYSVDIYKKEKIPNTEARPATLLKKRLWHMYFPVNFAKFLRKLFTDHLWATASEKTSHDDNGGDELLLRNC